MKILTIKKSQWYRGQGGHSSYLRRAVDGKMCCLGFDAIACGLSEEMITQVGYPGDAAMNYGDELPEEYRKNRLLSNPSELTELVSEAIRINDDEYMPDEERIEMLTPILKEIGEYDAIIWEE
jgi:hypothetical protein